MAAATHGPPQVRPLESPSSSRFFRAKVADELTLGKETELPATFLKRRPEAEHRTSDPLVESLEVSGVLISWR